MLGSRGGHAGVWSVCGHKSAFGVVVMGFSDAFSRVAAVMVLGGRVWGSVRAVGGVECVVEGVM